METSELVFLFIQEEGNINSRNEILMLDTILDQINMEGKSPNKKENPLNLLNDKTYKSNSLIINLEHPMFDDIIKTARENNPNISIILLYSNDDKEIISEIEEKYKIKYDIERDNINVFTFKTLFLKIKSDNVFIQKNQSGNQRYTLIQTLGSGTSSIVDLYYDNEQDRKVAVKKFKVEGMEQKEKEKIKKEVDNMKSIDIPTAIKCYDFEIENDNRFIYMEYANQGTLEKKLIMHKQKGIDFSTEEIFEYLIDIMLALFALNQKGMMHRDIKSENILLTTITIDEKEHLIAKLSDLGISRQIDGVLGSLTSCGTPYYVSPEIAAGEKRYDYNADIWSLGVVLYELITFNKPWYDATLSTQEFFKLVFTTDYPPLPKKTDPRLQYLVSIMLIKDPARRATLKEILEIDFMYELVTNLIKNNKWENVKDFEGIFELKQNISTCYLFMKVFNTAEEIMIMNDVAQISFYAYFTDYKPGFFSKTITNAIDADIFLLAFELKSDLPFNPDVINFFKYKKIFLNYKDREPDTLIKTLIRMGGLIPLNHKINDINNEEEMKAYIADLKKNPNDYFFQMPLGYFDPYNNGDNEKICNISCIDNPDEYSFLSLSQFLLHLGKSIFAQVAENLDSEKLITDKRYVQFIHGISFFQECDIFKIPYTENDKSRLAFLLNIYQIMLIHFQFNNIQKKFKVKAGLLSYLKNDISITYKFKNLTLNNLELKHVVFRNNKPMPGSYMRLVYNSDIKCQLLPNFDDLRVLLILPDFKKVKKLFFEFQIFNKKEVLEQLNDVTFNFIKKNIYLEEEEKEELLIWDIVEPILTDFGPNNTKENPEGFLEFLLGYINMNKEFISKKPSQLYKARFTSDYDLKSLAFLNQKLISDIHNGTIEVSYIF